MKGIDHGPNFYCTADVRLLLLAANDRPIIGPWVAKDWAKSIKENLRQLRLFFQIEYSVPFFIEYSFYFPIRQSKLSANEQFSVRDSARLALCLVTILLLCH